MTVPTVTTAPTVPAARTAVQDLQNAELLALAAQGDGSAWAEVVTRYRGLVSSVVRAYRMQEADARDAEQRTWLRLVEHLGSLRDPDRLGGWLATTASRECLRILREGQNVVGVEMDAVPATQPGIEEQVIDADTAARLWQIVAALPPRGRTIMKALFADEPRPYAEVARATGIPIGSLGPSRARLIDRVRRTFDDGTYATGAQ
jgi:RNA polymerase sigma factor (sigma-70 family)